MTPLYTSKSQAAPTPEALDEMSDYYAKDAERHKPKERKADERKEG